MYIILCIYIVRAYIVTYITVHLSQHRGANLHAQTHIHTKQHCPKSVSLATCSQLVSPLSWQSPILPAPWSITSMRHFSKSWLEGCWKYLKDSRGSRLPLYRDLWGSSGEKSMGIVDESWLILTHDSYHWKSSAIDRREIVAAKCWSCPVPQVSLERMAEHEITRIVLKAWSNVSILA